MAQQSDLKSKSRIGENNGRDITDLKSSCAPAVEVAFTTSLFTPEKWEQIKNDIVHIDEMAINRDRFDDATRMFMLKYYRGNFHEDDAAVALLSARLAGEEKVIGFVIARPDPHVADTMKIRATAITPQFQGRQLVGPLTECLEAEMLRLGYGYASRDATTENGYADKIVKNKGPAVVEDYKVGESHRYIRYRLSDNQ